ncbi:hypothetical protein CFHF_24745 [Caulobacter flavus]|uniref:Peptidase M61 catalytic domain-containing protein n=1 Tax=Caulobacter flavus TaxID=1679497 RepID=A0A2N5CLR6_9CAUL|nr:hypothetical protein [Caulobacter flavus]AYV48830.1 hypothetical protein C1707_22635 [Caulobacter flavus]PLR06712.1 hypothetical protein CFHF_24745 [Caulobacter flavus]
MSVAATLTLAVLAAPAWAAPEPGPVAYVVSPVMKDGELTALEITATFKADADGETRLSLPNNWMGRSGIWRNLSNLTVDGADSVVDDTPKARIVRSRPGRKLVLRYTVGDTLKREPVQSDGYPSEPWIRPSWFYVDGVSALVTVDGREAGPVSFRWGKAWPRDFKLASNLEDAGWDEDPRQSVLIGGRDLRILRAGPLRLAIRGDYAFTDAELSGALEKILEAERGFFGDYQSRPFLVSASSIRSESGASFLGTGKHQAFAMAATPNMTLDDMRVLLAHEIFHAWNPGRLGKTFGPRGYWFSEGFTDFYARRLMVRERLLTPAAFAAAWNETLRDYASSPAIAMPGQEAAEKFWTDPYADKLAYQRGALLAAIWDMKLRQAGSSLDAVLQEQARARGRDPEATMVDAFVEAAKAHGLDVSADIEAHIDQGRPIRLPADAFLPCARLVDVTTPVFDRGFEPKTDDTGTMTVADLREDSAAYRAGLREGMVIVERRKGGGGDPNTPYELVVREGDGPVRVVSFLPQGIGTQSHQMLALTPEAIQTQGPCAFIPAGTSTVAPKTYPVRLNP